MDEIDLEIIRLLAIDGRSSIKHLASSINLSPPAVSSRVDKLIEKGYIRGFQAQLELEKVGYPIKAFINLAMKPIRKPEFYKYIDSIPNVLECCCVTGDYSMHIKVAFKSTKELDTFINEIQQFGDTMTQIVFSTAVESRQIGL